MSVDFDAVIALLKRQLPGLIAIYRFGSAGTPYENESSDLDLAVLATHPLDNLARWDLAETVARQVGRDVDLIDLIRAAPPIRIQIFSEGERIYCADTKVSDEFEVTSMSQYQHFNEERREVLADFLARTQRAL